MALTDGETLRNLLRQDPDEALKILEHDLFGMLSVIHGGALLLSEDLKQTDGYVLKNLETLRQIADVVLHEAVQAQAYLDDLYGKAKEAG